MSKYFYAQDPYVWSVTINLMQQTCVIASKLTSSLLMLIREKVSMWQKIESPVRSGSITTVKNGSLRRKVNKYYSFGSGMTLYVNIISRPTVLIRSTTFASDHCPASLKLSLYCVYSRLSCLAHWRCATNSSHTYKWSPSHYLSHSRLSHSHAEARPCRYSSYMQSDSEL